MCGQLPFRHDNRAAATARGILGASAAFGVALLVAAGCERPLTPRTVVAHTDEWVFAGATGCKITTDHYTIYTTCRDKALLDALPLFMESCYDEYAKLLPVEGAPPGPMEAYLFRSRWQWEHFTDEFAPARAATYKRIREGGYSERGVTVSQYGSRRGTLSILAHEGLHQYLEATGRQRIPAWINEGLACYFEAFSLDLATNQPVFTPKNNTHRLPSLRQALTTESLIPLREVLSTNAGEAIHQRSRHVRNYYAQEWALVLFLLDSPQMNKYAPGFQQLLRELGTEAMNRRARAYLAADSLGGMSAGEAVFRAYITEDLDTFERDYRAFIEQLAQLAQG